MVTDESIKSENSIEEKPAPVYTAEDEQPVKVKFFVNWESYESSDRGYFS